MRQRVGDWVCVPGFDTNNRLLFIWGGRACVAMSGTGLCLCLINTLPLSLTHQIGYSNLLYHKLMKPIVGDSERGCSCVWDAMCLWLSDNPACLCLDAMLREAGGWGVGGGGLKHPLYHQQSTGQGVNMFLEMTWGVFHRHHKTHQIEPDSSWNPNHFIFSLKLKIMSHHLECCVKPQCSGSCSQRYPTHIPRLNK